MATEDKTHPLLSHVVKKITEWITILITAFAGSYFTAQSVAEESRKILEEKIDSQEIRLLILAKAEDLFRERLTEALAEQPDPASDPLPSERLAKVEHEVREALLKEAIQDQDQNQDPDVEYTQKMTQQLSDWTQERGRLRELTQQVQAQMQQSR